MDNQVWAWQMRSIGRFLNAEMSYPETQSHIGSRHVQ